MTDLVTAAQLSALLPTNKQFADWLLPINTYLPTFGINSSIRLANFMAQMSHESADFTRLRENLNYSAQGLKATWPNRFDDISAPVYARNPEKIANKVYANRLGNGSEASGDGWKFRGRGIIQITGKVNYTDCSKAIFGDARLVDNPELLETDKNICVQAAGWFWQIHKLNELADRGDINEITKRINGGYTGLDDRTRRYTAAKKILGV